VTYLILFGNNNKNDLFLLEFNHFFSPIITLNWSQIVLHSNNVFEFSTIEPLRKQINEKDLEINDAHQQNDSGKIRNEFLFFLSIEFINF